MSSSEKTTEVVAHPLEPLKVEEISTAAEILRKEKNLGNNHRFVSVVLHEPPKEKVLSFQNGDPAEREAFAILLDKADGKTYEAVVSLSEEAVKSWSTSQACSRRSCWKSSSSARRSSRRAPSFGRP